jgi:uncharacterized membrane protein
MVRSAGIGVLLASGSQRTAVWRARERITSLKEKADEPGKRIAWRSIGGESDNAGEVIFEDAPGGRGTLVTVLQEFRMGKLASAWENVRRPQSETSGDRESATSQGPR